jgi:small conductance mechanosensitive channel
MNFGISYKDYIDKARSVIQKVAASCEFIDHSQPIDIIVSELGASSVNFAVRPWCKTEDFWNVHFYMHENIKKTFDKENIRIPFPQRDVHHYYPEGKK